MEKRTSFYVHLNQRNFFLKHYKKLLTIVTPFVISFLSPTLVNSCSKDLVVCNWIDKVFIVRAGDMTASAISLGNDFYVTNKHVVEDNLSIQIMKSDGSFVAAHVLPNGHESDLVLLSLNESPEILIKNFTTPSNMDDLHSVAYGVGRGKVRIFPRGDLISFPPENMKQARIHSTIRNLPGISGGALINSSGDLVGVLAAGSGLYNESVPVHILNEVIAESLVSEKKFLDRGKAFKLCTQLLLDVAKLDQQPSAVLLSKVKYNCDKANNKTLFDMAGQVFGTFGLLAHSITFLEKSVKLDPNSPTSLLSLAIALQFQRSYERQVKVLDHLLTFLQDDPLVLRMSIQAAAFSKNKSFAKKSLKLLQKNNPNAYPQAFEFLENHFESM